jgi:hypothetical protein
MAFKLKPQSIAKVFLMPGKPETDGPVFGGNAIFLQAGETTDIGPEKWIKVQFPGTRVEGWLPMSLGDIVPDPARPPLDEEGFVYSALIAEQVFNNDASTAPNFVFADYVLALAFIESGMTNAGATPPSDAIGPLQITVARWQDFVTNGKPFSDRFTDGRDWPSAQIYCASSRMHADGKAIIAAQPAGAQALRLTLLDIFHAYLTDSPAAALAMKTAAADAANAAKPPAQIHAALTAALVTAIFNKLKSFVPGAAAPATFGDLIKFTGSALDAALQKAFDLIKTNAPELQTGTVQKATDPVQERPNGPASPASGLHYPASVAAGNRQFGDMIVARFATAGFGQLQQKAAVANAIRESALNPNAASHPPERSFGLFQCNTGGGLGNGFTQAQLSNPETNIAIIIKEAKRHSNFVNAASLHDAVDAFVRGVERPANPANEVALRSAIAQAL